MSLLKMAKCIDSIRLVKNKLICWIILDFRSTFLNPWSCRNRWNDWFDLLLARFFPCKIVNILACPFLIRQLRQLIVMSWFQILVCYYDMWSVLCRQVSTIKMGYLWEISFDNLFWENSNQNRLVGTESHSYL